MEDRIIGGEEVKALSDSVLNRSSVWTLKSADSYDRNRV